MLFTGLIGSVNVLSALLVPADAAHHLLVAASCGVQLQTQLLHWKAGGQLPEPEHRRRLAASGALLALDFVAFVVERLVG